MANLKMEQGNVKVVIKKDTETQEWVGRWYEDGKYDEGKTIYDVTKQDVIDTVSATFAKMEKEKDHSMYREINHQVHEDLSVSEYSNKDGDYRVLGLSAHGVTSIEEEEMTLESGTVCKSMTFIIETKEGVRSRISIDAYMAKDGE